MNDERKAAGKFLEQMMSADAKSGTKADEAFLIHFDREVELLQDFTNVRDKAAARVGQHRSQRAGEP